MTTPTIIYFGNDASLKRSPKIFLRTLLYSTSVKGKVVESLYLKLCRGGSEQIFSFWGYGETNDLSIGSGLFVGQTGVTFNHHFVLSEQHAGYQFSNGVYFIQVFARVVGWKTVFLDEITLTLTKDNADLLTRHNGVLFELDPHSGNYVGHSHSAESPFG